MPSGVKENLTGLRYGTDSQLEVLDRVGGTGKLRNCYKVKCHVCSKDIEMFGEGIFITSIASIKRGARSCGCIKNYRYSEAQWILRLKRAGASRDFEYVKRVSDFRGDQTVVELKCNIDGNTWQARCGNVCKGRGCHHCANRSHETPLEESIRRFELAGVFPSGTTFEKDGSSKQGTQMWKVSCPVCYKDEFTRAGLCTGSFRTQTGALERGVMSCRCSPQPQLTIDQKEYLIDKNCQGQAEFIRWESSDTAKGTSSVVIKCKTHGEQTTRFINILKNEKVCPECAVGSFNKNSPLSYFYVLRISGAATDFVGYGITSNLSTRLATHKSELGKNGYLIDEIVLFCGTGQEVYDTELRVKRGFPRFPRDVRGFISENTSSHMFNELINFVSSKLRMDSAQNSLDIT